MSENTPARTGRKVGAEVTVSMDGYSGTGPEDVVCSTTLKHEDLGKTSWTNARISADVEAEVGALKTQPGRDILVLNSASIIQTLLKADLIDDLYLTVVPSTLGSGRRVLPDDYASKWQLASATAFPSSGAVALHYQRP